jgi:hypothetical protein
MRNPQGSIDLTQLDRKIVATIVTVAATGAAAIVRPMLNATAMEAKGEFTTLSGKMNTAVAKRLAGRDEYRLTVTSFRSVGESVSDSVSHSAVFQ